MQGDPVTVRRTSAATRGRAAPKKPERLDRERAVVAAASRVSDERARSRLADAIALLPDAALETFARRSFDKAEIRVPTVDGLLQAAQAFREASHRGDYHESFNVNSKNYMNKSPRTRAWIAECRRLLASCERAVTTGKRVSEARTAYEIVFALVDQIEEDSDTIVFFADEPGVWQLGIEWEPALRGWIRCLAATAGADELANELATMLAGRGSSHRAKLMAEARKIASPDQLAALDAAGSRRRRRR